MSEVEWIRSKRLSELLKQQRPELWPFEAPLRRYLAQGLIGARSKRTELKYKDRNRDQPSLFETDWQIPASTWTGRGPVPANFELAGDFLATPVSGSDYWAVYCVGLSFNLADVMEAFELDESELQPNSDIEAATLPPTIHTGFAGRPSQSHLIIRLLKGWVDENSVPEGQVTEIAKRLADAFNGKEEYANLPRANWKTIANSMRDEIKAAIAARVTVKLDESN